MEVLLINPPAAEGIKQVREGRCEQRAGAWTAVWTPITLATIASVLRENNFTVDLKDCIVEELSFEDIGKFSEKSNPQLVIVNAITPSLNSDLSIAYCIKKMCKNVKIAVLGIHCSVLPAECLELCKDVDFVIRGEPEYTIRDLALSLRDKRLQFKGIKGLSYREEGQIIHNEPRNVIDNLDELPFPAWDLINREKYVLPFSLRKFLLISTSRGCPYSCLFCADNAYYGKKLRKRSPVRIVDELQWDKEKFGVQDFLFWSESFTLDQNFAMAVAGEIINRKVDVNWVCNSRVDNVDFKLLKAFKKAGCWMIGYGVESGSQRILDLMVKKTTLIQTKEAVKLAKMAGLKITAHCIFGFPGETVDTMRETLDFVKGLDIDFVQFYCAVPFPGSKLYDLKEKMYKLTSTNWKFFEQNFCIMHTEWLSPEEVMAFRRKAYKEFYLRPRIIGSIIKEIRSYKALVNFVKGVKEFRSWVE